MENHSPEETNGNEKDTTERSGWKIYLTHPTNLPLTIGILYLIALVILANFYSPLGNDRNSNTAALLFFPIGFLLGLSGFMNLITKTTVRLRYIWHESSAYLDGAKNISRVGWLHHNTPLLVF